MTKINRYYESGPPRDRLISATADLIARHGVSRVGIKTILVSANCAKASLYDNFRSKTDLMIAALDYNYEQTIQQCLFDGAAGDIVDPAERLLAIFDVMHDFCGNPAYPGCASIKAMLETDPDTPIHEAAKRNLSRLRNSTLAIVTNGAWQSSQKFASVWHTLMVGAMVCAAEGRMDSALMAKEAGRQLLSTWPKEATKISNGDAARS